MFKSVASLWLISFWLSHSKITSFNIIVLKKVYARLSVQWSLLEVWWMKKLFHIWFVHVSCI